MRAIEIPEPAVTRPAIPQRTVSRSTSPGPAVREAAIPEGAVGERGIVEPGMPEQTLGALALDPTSPVFRPDPAGDLPARRRELAAFLRSRRDRMSPEAVGLVSGRRRRAPGLRREEVAQLAGVGVTWYTWLEQGRPINASPDVLEAIARTLRLDATERDHMFRLADVSTPAGPPTRSCLEPEVQTILDGLEPLPASVVNTRYDLLAWNRSYEVLFSGITQAPPDERNLLWQIFTVQPCPVTNGDHEFPRLVATFRAAYARHLSEPSWTELVERLCAASPLFAELWSRHDVAEPRNRLKHFRLESGEELLLYSTIFNVTETPDARMTVYTPANDAAARFMERLRNPTVAAL